MRLRATAQILALSMLASTSLPGQTDSVASPKHFCFRGQPAPACTAFAITEFGGALGSGHDYSFEGHSVERGMVFWELGLMRNLGSRSALGGTVLLTSRFSLGLKARYRHWLGRGFSLDVAPGLTVYDERNYAQVPAFTGHVTLNYGDWISIGGMLETSAFDPAPFLGWPAATITKPFLTARVGSYPGLIGGAGLGLLVGVVALLYQGGLD